jgi:hypothetical protein
MSSDQCLVSHFRFVRENRGVTEHQLLLELMRQSERAVPLAYPSEDEPEFIIQPDGQMLWEAPKPKSACPKCEGEADADPE